MRRASQRIPTDRAKARPEPGVGGIRQMQKQNAPLGKRCKCLGAVEEHRTLAEGIPKGVLDGVGERMPV